MLITLLAYLPILIAPLVAIALTAGLQRWVKPHGAPSIPTTPSTATDLVPVAAVRAPRLTWDDIAKQANPLVAYVLPIISSVVIVLLALWPFAYLGWVIIELDPDPGWADQVPPWFGNFGYFLGFGMVGVVIAVVATLFGGVLGLGLHALGKCILWPEVCGCGEAEAADSESGESEGAEHDV